MRNVRSGDPSSTGRNRRMRAAVAALALTAAVTAGGIATAAPAAAANDNEVWTDHVGDPSNAWRETWAIAWDLCKVTHPGTKSIELSKVVDKGETTAGRKYTAYWTCRYTA